MEALKRELEELERQDEEEKRRHESISGGGSTYYEPVIPLASRVAEVPRKQESQYGDPNEYFESEPPQAQAPSANVHLTESQYGYQQAHQDGGKVTLRQKSSSSVHYEETRDYDNVVDQNQQFQSQQRYSYQDREDRVSNQRNSYGNNGHAYETAQREEAHLDNTHARDRNQSFVAEADAGQSNTDEDGYRQKSSSNSYENLAEPEFSFTNENASRLSKVHTARQEDLAFVDQQEAEAVQQHGYDLDAVEYHQNQSQSNRFSSYQTEESNDYDEGAGNYGQSGANYESAEAVASSETNEISFTASASNTLKRSSSNRQSQYSISQAEEQIELARKASMMKRKQAWSRKLSLQLGYLTVSYDGTDDSSSDGSVINLEGAVVSKAKDPQEEIWRLLITHYTQGVAERLIIEPEQSQVDETMEAIQNQIELASSIKAKWEERSYELHEGYLRVFIGINDDKKPEMTVDLSDVTIRPLSLPSMPFCVSIVRNELNHNGSSNAVLTMEASTPSEQQRWIEALQSQQNRARADVGGI